MHKCNREECPTLNVKGPKLKCAKCKNECFLKCYGFDKAEKVDGSETVQFNLPGGAVMYAYVQTIAFVCCESYVSSTELKSVMPKLNKQRAPSKTRATNNETAESFISNELATIKSLLTTIRNTTDANAADLEDIKSNTNELNVNIKTLGNSMRNETPRVQRLATSSFAEKLKSNARTPVSQKRYNRDMTEFPGLNERARLKVPTPKKGTRAITIGKPVVQRQPKPTFDKAVWVSGLNSETTTEEMINYVLSNTSIEYKSQLDCHKLVKKDADLSKLSFVSFKISVNNDHFDILMNPDIWPNYVAVREFRQLTTFGDFITKVNTPDQTPNNEKKQRTDGKNDIVQPSMPVVEKITIDE